MLPQRWSGVRNASMPESVSAQQDAELVHVRGARPASHRPLQEEQQREESDTAEAHPPMPNQPNCGAALACGCLSELSAPTISGLFRSCFHHACSGREHQPQLYALTVVSMARSTLTMIVVTSGCDENHSSLGRQNAHEPWKIAQKTWFQSLRGHRT